MAEAEKEEVNEEQLDKIIAEDGAEIVDEDAHANFLSGFEEDAGSIDTPAKDDADEDDQDKSKPDDDSEAEFEEGKVDDLEDKDESESKAEEIKPTESSDEVVALQSRLRKMEGKFGELNAKLMEAAKTETKAAGSKSPTKKQIDEAMGDSEKLSFLNKEFPEYYDSLKEMAGLIKDDILSDLPESVDTDAILSTVDERISRQVLDITHKGWKDTINSKEFMDFAHQDGPSPTERQLYYGLPQNDQRRPEVFQALMDAYPEWGEKYGVLLNSGNISDVADILDQFSESQTAQDTTQNKPSSRKDRLSRSVAATKSTSKAATRQANTPHDNFKQGFDEA